MTPEAAGPRIAPIEAPYEPAIAEQLAKWMPPGSDVEPLRLFRTLAVHDGLFGRMRPLGAGILGHGRISAREREILIHRTCARAGAEYEWGVHVVGFAGSVGLSERQIAATVHGDCDDPAWSPEDRPLVRLADELYEDCGVSDGLWQELAQRYTPDQLLELVIVCGWYRLLSSVINASGVELEEWAASFPPVPV